MKKELSLAFALLLFATAWAQETTITKGEKLSQAQLDDINAEELAFSPENIAVSISQTTITVNYSVASVQKDKNAPTYTVVEKPLKLHYSMTAYANCRKNSSIIDCITKINNYFVSGAVIRHKQEKAKIKTWQTKEDLTSEIKIGDIHLA